MSLNKHQIFAAKDLKESFVEVPEWGGKVKLKALSMQEQLDYDTFLSNKPNEIDAALRLVILACVDDSDNKLFNEEDLKELKKKDSVNLLKVVEAILELNNMKAKSVDNLAKN